MNRLDMIDSILLAIAAWSGIILAWRITRYICGLRRVHRLFAAAPQSRSGAGLIVITEYYDS